MISFRHFYEHIIIQEIVPVDVRPDRAVGTADFKILAPKDWPPKIVGWLARRKLKKELRAFNLRSPK